MHTARSILCLKFVDEIPNVNALYVCVYTERNGRTTAKATERLTHTLTRHCDHREGDEFFREEKKKGVIHRNTNIQIQIRPAHRMRRVTFPTHM